MVDQIKFEQELAQQQLKTQFSVFLLGSFLIILLIVFISVLRIRKKTSEHERSSLLKELEQIKERFTLKSVATSVVRRENEFKLNKDALELFIGTSLGESSWNILNVIFENPTISNKGIGEKVFLSEEGVSSSLRRMYKTFDIQAESKQNLKVALISRALELSVENVH